MPDNLWQHSQQFGVAGIFASLSGFVSYLTSVQEGRPFKWTELVLNVISSGLAGVVSCGILLHYQMDIEFTCALCGVAGWLGTRFWKIVDVLVFRRVGVKQEDIR